MRSPILLAVVALGCLGNPHHRSCGRVKPYIIGGLETSIDKAAYQLSLEYFAFHVGGASVISEFWALTAAHCLIHVADVHNIRLRSNTDLKEAGGHIHYVAEAIIHQGFDVNAMDYDVAVMRVTQPFNQENVIRLSTVRPSVGTVATITGWGHTKENGAPSNNLRWVDVGVVEQSQCIELNAAVSIVITDRMFCAGKPGGGKDACQGDSGGPLVVGDVQVGIVSQGKGCGRLSQGIYTDIANVRDWIEKNTGLSSELG